MFLIRAHHIIRKSRTDPGKLGVWLVNASSPEEALATWRSWCSVHEAGQYDTARATVQPDPRPVIRLA